MKVYVAGAWVEQHERARPWIAQLRKIGATITCDWTVAEGASTAGSDAALSREDRIKHSTNDLLGVLTADVVWLLAANDKGACGSWVELGAALAAKHLRNNTAPRVIVSGPKARRSIFTEIADELHDTDEDAFSSIRPRVSRAQPVVMWGGRAMQVGTCAPDRKCLACERLGEHLEPIEGGA